MDNRDDEIEGALTGALAVLAANWVRADNHNQRLVANAKEEAHNASSTLRNLINSGFIQRLTRPIVSDALGGLLLAEQRADQPSVTPSLQQIRRISLAHGMKQHIDQLRWPPKEGQYDDQGLCIKAGDLVTLFLGLTYGESKSWNLGLLQHDAPNRDQREQIFLAAHALTKVLYGTGLSFDEFVAAWKRLFTGAVESTTSADPHEDTANPPTIAGVNVNLTSVVALGSETLGNAYSYLSQNTDRTNKWRITVGPVGVPVAQTLFQVNYSSQFKRKNQLYVPMVAAQGLGMSAVSVTPSGFGVQSIFALSANTVVDVGFSTMGG